MRLLLALLMLGSSLAAEPWQGNWAAEPDWCVWQDKIGSHTPAPIAITATEVLGYENSCDIKDVIWISENAWKLVLNCYSEGSEYDDERVLLLENKNTMWMWWGAGAPLRFTRCEGK